MMTAIKNSARPPFLPDWMTHRHPVYDLEARRRADNRSMSVLRLGCIPAILAGSTFSLGLILGTSVLSQLQWSYGWYSYSGIMIALLSWAIATLVAIQFAAGALVNVLTVAQTSPIISGEIELQSWRLLRTTTLKLREIIFAKYAAALQQMRGPLFGLLILRAASTITILILTVTILLRTVFYYMDRAAWQDFWLKGEWFPILIAYLACLLLYLTQPVLQLLLNGAIGLTASTHTSTRAQAIAASMVGRLASWVAIVMINVSLMLGLNFLHSEWMNGPYSAFDAYRDLMPPGDTAVLWIVCLIIAGYALSAFIGQIGAILCLLGITLRRARHLGV
jgi:hypothetical protein